MWNASVYSSPDTFDAARFLKRRQIKGLENSSLLVATSKDHTAFSHGKHACPGRFFAANEVKIALLHVLLKYDVRLQDVNQAQWIENGINMMANPFAVVQVRRRNAEIDLASLQGGRAET